MTSKDRIILQKISTYIDDVAQYVDSFSFEDFMSDKKGKHGDVLFASFAVVFYMEENLKA